MNDTFQDFMLVLAVIASIFSAVFSYTSMENTLQLIETGCAK